MFLGSAPAARGIDTGCDVLEIIAGFPRALSGRRRKEAPVDAGIMVVYWRGIGS